MGFFDILKMLLLAAAEGLTEWLPVSNTGHISVLGHYLGFADWNASTVLRELYVGAATLGAVLAACALFLPGNGPFSKTLDGKRVVADERVRFFTAIGIGWIPCLLLSLIFGSKLSDFLYDPKAMQNQRLTVVCMIVGGALFLLAELRNRKRIPRYERMEEVPVKIIMVLGLTQLAGFLPGASRFGLAILVAMALGVSRKTSVTLAVFVNMPAAIVCGALPILRNLGHIGGIYVSEMMMASILAFLISFFALRAILSVLTENSMARFGRYRIAFGVLLYLFFIL